MSVNHYRSVCTENQGRPVEIRTVDGEIHRGIIDRVDESCVYLRPMEELGGFGYGLIPFGIGIAFGAILSLAFLSWW